MQRDEVIMIGTARTILPIGLAAFDATTLGGSRVRIMGNALALVV